MIDWLTADRQRGQGLKMQYSGMKAATCEKCSFKEMSDEAYHNYVQRYLSAMEPEERVDEEVYRLRLMECGRCGYIQNGLCRMCGCFVEIRAASIYRRCPDAEAKWLEAGAEKE